MWRTYFEWAVPLALKQSPSGSEIGTRGFVRPDQGDVTRLFNLAPLIPSERRYSRIYRGGKELIDHIFASHELLLRPPQPLPIVDSHVDAAEVLPSIEDQPGLRRGQPGSDHAPVTAVFEL
ncbi:MAG: hypothetical protein AAF152_16610 [Cyanobacteria bacterium P01_A01_bin.114]